VVKLWTVFAELCNQLFSLFVEIRPHAQEIDSLDYALVGEENCEICDTEGPSKLFPGNQGDKFTIEDAFELFGEQSQQIFGGFFEVGVEEALEKDRVDVEPTLPLAERPYLAEVSANFINVLVDQFSPGGF
jgi:hypothetical protein